jgi:DNA-binding NarL/FixJ family response regulator
MQSPSRTIRIVVADDHGVVRQGIIALLSAQTDFEVVGGAGNGAEALALVEQTRPDLLLVDLNMPGGPVPDAIREIRSRCPETQIVVLTMFEDVDHARSALDAGAIGYVLKQASDTELVQAIRSVATGRPYVDGRLALRALSPASNEAAQKDSSLDLSAREIQVLVLLARGYTQKECASKLDVSVKSIGTYRARLAEKLGVRSRAELVSYAAQAGLLSEQEQSKST